MKLKRVSSVSVALVLAGTFATLASAQTTVRVSHPTPATSHYGAGTQAFCADLEKRTTGRFKCQIQAGANDERASVEAVQLGTLDVTNTSTGPVSNFVPEVGIVDIPFLFRDYDHARRVLDGPIGQEILAKFPSKGIIALAWTENGFRHLTNSRRPVVKPDDVKGLKVRTMQNPVHIQAFQSIGVQPTPMAFSELFTSLQQGVVDGQENPIPVILSSKFSQVQKHLSLTGHVYSPSLLLMSPKLWNSLSEADRTNFREAAKAGSAAQRKKVNDDENAGIAQLKSDGMEVVTNVDGQAFRNAMTPVWSEFAKKYGADNIRRIQEFK
ncbi:MAG TPA: TRAP transporter substrate-binding protein [Burkholderiaceae bacterium]|nr:TRAP transporter substrate-binding protein [Burkholderiaceae bacterium]